MSLSTQKKSCGRPSETESEEEKQSETVADSGDSDTEVRCGPVFVRHRRCARREIPNWAVSDLEDSDRSSKCCRCDRSCRARNDLHLPNPPASTNSSVDFPWEVVHSSGYQAALRGSVDLSRNDVVAWGKLKTPFLLALASLVKTTERFALRHSYRHSYGLRVCEVKSQTLLWLLLLIFVSEERTRMPAPRRERNRSSGAHGLLHKCLEKHHTKPANKNIATVDDAFRPVGVLGSAPL